MPDHIKCLSGYLIPLLYFLHAAIDINQALPAFAQEPRVQVVYSSQSGEPSEDTSPALAAHQESSGPSPQQQQAVLDPNIPQQPISDFRSLFMNPIQYAQQQMQPSQHQQQMLPGFSGVDLLQGKLNNLLQYKASMWQKLPSILPANPIIDTPDLVKKLTPDWSGLNTRSPLYKMYGGHSPLGELLAVKADLIPQIIKTGFLAFVALKVLGVLASVVKAKKALLVAKKKLMLAPLAILAAKNSAIKDGPPSAEEETPKKETKRDRRSASSASPVIEGEMNIEKIMSQLETTISRFLHDHQ